ncbi:LuxR C-terminal-related transcriptional regulator [Rhodococcus sp. NPDC003318]|uniref:LuxR C-terminal-related transcriptional regulator n=1 Tax=Rhodococcus sp. NPDC003318 TaxID=3364503 RepID=UPI0036B9ABFB
MAMITLGLTLEFMTDSPRAIENYERALRITEGHGETNYQSYLVWGLAIARWNLGDHERPAELLKQALKLGRKINDRLNTGMCMQAMSWVAVDNNDPRRAAVLMGAAEGVTRSAGGTKVVVPGLSLFQDACERDVRNKLGEKVFEEACRKGAELGFHDAVDFALGEERPRSRTSGTGRSTRPTKRELEVADLVAEGLTDKEIAARLVISPRTAQGHVEHLLVKLGFNSRAQIAVWVAQSRRDEAEDQPSGD